jgi:ribosomal protein L11 methyltransferase
VSEGRAEEARATMNALFPAGFEEVEIDGGVELAAYVPADAATTGLGALGPVASTDVPVDWRGAWRGFHRPVRIGPLWVGPPWEQPAAGELGVVVDPGLAFGTGAHPTTRLCLELLLETAPGSLLDLGAGSGVLAIAAARIGFAPVTALDVDPLALAAIRRNARTNGVAVGVAGGDALSVALPATDVAVANIALAEVERIGARVVAPRLIVSGYLAAERPRVPGRLSVERREQEGWAADVLEQS